MRPLEAFHFNKTVHHKEGLLQPCNSADSDPGNIRTHEEQRVECSCADRRHDEIHAECLLIRYTDALPTEQCACSPGNTILIGTVT